MIELISAIATSLIIIILSGLLSKHMPVKLFAATILCAIAFIYVGFALKENIISHIIKELSAALIFFFIAIIGYTKSKLIAYGIMLHGAWDFCHHLLLQSVTPSYWPVYCFAVDIMIGIYFLLYFKSFKIKANKNMIVADSKC